jgi:hypothetical protein
MSKWPLLTSIPACRDALCNETKHRYFEFKWLENYKRVKTSNLFYFSYIIYPLLNTPDLFSPKIIITSSLPFCIYDGLSFGILINPSTCNTTIKLFPPLKTIKRLDIMSRFYSNTKTLFSVLWRPECTMLYAVATSADTSSNQAIKDPGQRRYGYSNFGKDFNIIITSSHITRLVSRGLSPEDWELLYTAYYCIQGTIQPHYVNGFYCLRIPYRLACFNTPLTNTENKLNLCDWLYPNPLSDW